MDWSQLPPLNSLRAFSALAEHKSYSRAGAALNVTHAAVLQQVRALELRLGVALVERDGRNVRLTGDGRRLARRLDAGFGTIHRGVADIRDGAACQPVRVTMSPAFAAEWLMPRLADFRSRHPAITLQLIPTAEVLPLAPGGADLAVRYRPADRVADTVDTILLADMVVLGTPGLIGARPVARPADLAALPWLQELGTDEVADWLRRRGETPVKPLQISDMPGYLIMDAVRRGDGVTYTARPFFEAEIAAGAMQVLHCEPGFGHYTLEIRDGAVPDPVGIFADWLRQVAQTGA